MMGEGATQKISELQHETVNSFLVVPSALLSNRHYFSHGCIQRCSMISSYTFNGLACVLGTFFTSVIGLQTKLCGVKRMSDVSKFESSQRGVTNKEKVRIEEFLKAAKF